jgi:hypothetical protein
MESKQSNIENSSGPMSPEKVMENSKVVAESLRMLNIVIDQQRKSISALAVELMQATINLVKDANAILQVKSPADKQSLKDSINDTLEKLVNLTNKTASGTQSSTDTKNLQDTISTPENLKESTQHVLNLAYNNTVSAQQQLNITGQAVLVQGIGTLYAVVTAALGQVESKKLKSS